MAMSEPMQSKVREILPVEIKEELLTMLNKALELEHAARIQYLTHAEQISGPDAEKIIERLKEIAQDEERHEGMFRNLIGSYFYELPSMVVASTHSAKDREEIFNVNIKDEKVAVDYYKEIYRKVVDNKKSLQYSFETLEHEIRHVIIDEQEHIAELSLIFGQEFI